MAVPIISVVVPVYNIEKYLDRCITSILNQTFRDFELLLVDDGCTDNSGAICDRYASNDDRVRVFHKPNGGVSSARNRGIEEAQGQFICFVDSDDWVETTYLQIFMDYSPEKYGVVLQSFYYDYENTGLTIPHILPENEIFKASNLEFFLEYTDGVHNGFLWHRLFHTDIIKEYDIRYPENVSYAEDGIFFLHYISKVSTFYISDKPGYHYFIRNNSLTGKGKQLSYETSAFLLGKYVEMTSEIIRKDQPSLKIEKGLKLYMWRLCFEWLIQKSTEDYAGYLKIKKLLSSYSDFFYDKSISARAFSFNQIMRILRRKPSKLRYNELILLMKLFEIEKKIYSKISDMCKK